MTVQEVRLCGLLLREHFGEVVEKVGTHLLQNGEQNLRTIIQETGTSLDLVLLLLSQIPGLFLSQLHTIKTVLCVLNFVRSAVC